MNTENLKNLAISDSGFIFDPTSGKTYTVSQTGLDILNYLKKGEDLTGIPAKILAEYEITQDQFDRDFSDFLIQLKEYGLVQ
ncbi:MAG: HPr-rel-A system PqqD family peptide chaperone [Leptospiraceae bacterium]|nr:HPr-rel-A system PqqD family peptide chaperone [Leptospiraceae bacterium]MCP5511148.1 HPr-rel-A system PqqD family peptide chaperone [Leptospiraceae bacterium]